MRHEKLTDRVSFLCVCVCFELCRYRPTDFATLDNGDLVLLERRHKGNETSFRLEIVHASLLEEDLGGGAQNQTRPAKVIVPALVAESFASATNAVDNMEGVSVDYLSKGEVILTIISDDNFSPTQRTLLLTFEVPGEE